MIGLVGVLDLVAFAGMDGTVLILLVVPVALVVAVATVAFFYLLALVHLDEDRSVTQLWRAAFLTPVLTPGTSVFVLAELALVGWVMVSVPALLPLVGVSAPIALVGWVTQRRSELLRSTRERSPRSRR